MNERKAIARELDGIEAELRDLEIRFEQYFAGVEKREPMQDREKVAKRLRRFANRRIIQTDLRFRYQSLATRYHSYCGHWDRILRLMDEGRYVRQVAKARSSASSSASASASAGDEVDTLYQDLLKARSACKVGGPEPDRDQVAALLRNQRDKVRERFGGRDVEFRVVTEEGKPKIKVRAKK